MYNAAKYIENTIASVLNQERHTFNIEIIIVDDCSKDNSIEIVEQIKDNRIKIIYLEMNLGLSNARNTGVKFSTGKWIQFLDSDDRISYDLFKKFEMTLQPQFNCYLFSIICEFENYSLKQKFLTVKDIRIFGLLGTACNKFIKREICIEFKLGYLFEDIIFNVEMMNRKDLNINIINDAYYYYNRQNSNSIIANFNEIEFNRMFNYVCSQIDVSNNLTKMYILEVFGALIFDKYRPFAFSLKIALKTLIKLYKYLPKTLLNQNRGSIMNQFIKK